MTSIKAALPPSLGRCSEATQQSKRPPPARPRRWRGPLFNRLASPQTWQQTGKGSRNTVTRRSSVSSSPGVKPLQIPEMKKVRRELCLGLSHTQGEELQGKEGVPASGEVGLPETWERQGDTIPPSNKEETSCSGSRLKFAF